MERVPAGAEGLDFGCGPGPVLATLLTAEGRRTVCYDPYYAPDEQVFSRTYDFITASEVLEHLHHPRFELDRLFRALRPGGWLGVMTQAPPEGDGFERWPYLRDRTHVAFYSRATFEFVAAHWAATPVFLAGGVTLLHKL